MDIVKTLLAFLQKNGYIMGNTEKNRTDTVTAEIELKKPKDLFIRDSILGMGTILLEDLEKHYYITSLKVGFMGNVSAYALIMREEEKAKIAVYAHEGLIPQKLKEKGVAKLKERLSV